MEQLSKSKINSLRDDLIAFNEAYRKGEPQISDIEYDRLVEVLRANNPQDDFFKKGVIEQPTERMEKLPLPMYSLEKIKTVQAFRKWLEKMSAAGCQEIVSTPKFDGISLIVDENAKRAWTRGDGIEGQISDRHFQKMCNGESPDNEPYLLHTWGEAIMKKTVFAHLKENHPEFTYKNARNMVAGLFNAPNGNESPFIGNVDFVRYGSDIPLDKDEQLAQMRELFSDSVTASVEFFIDELLELTDEELDMVLDLELHDRFNAEYKIDGVVLEVNEAEVREALGRLPNGNPAYAIAFKKEEWCDVYQTKVMSIEKGIGKTGVLNPVIIIEPVEINGATVSRATAYNASYLVDQHICEGALIEVTRGGDVIPKHLKTIEYSEQAFTDMMDDLVVCPSCGEPLKWNETHVDLVCSNHFCKEKVISELTYFFRTMGCEEFDEPTIRKLYDEGFATLDDILELKKEVFQAVLGKSAGKTVFEQINKVMFGVPLARYMAALNIFDGKIAENTCQKILDGLDKKTVMEIMSRKFLLSTTGEKGFFKKKLENIQGVGKVLSQTFIEGVEKFIEIEHYPVRFVFSPTEKLEDNPNRLYVCFTGFRDKKLEAILTQRGHIVLNGVTKECTVLVAADVNSSSSKITTAKKRGLRVISREDFENEIMEAR